MYNGKYHNKKSRLRWSKQFVLLASVIVLLVGAIGGSLAYLFTNTDPVVNTFTPGQVNITVDEEFDGNVKNNVRIKNTGNVDAKIRAMIVVTWQKDGMIYPDAPKAETDYTISNLPGAGWTLSNGWYVYNDPVPCEDDPSTKDVIENCTGYLFTQCVPIANKTPEGYHLVVDVIAEAIQADGGASF